LRERRLEVMENLINIERVVVEWGEVHGPVHATAEYTVNVEKDVEQVAMKAMGLIAKDVFGGDCFVAYHEDRLVVRFERASAMGIVTEAIQAGWRMAKKLDIFLANLKYAKLLIEAIGEKESVSPLVER
jgi:hypothetical protein